MAPVAGPIFSVLLLSLAAWAGGQSLRKLGHFSAPHAAFSSVVDLEDSASPEARSTLIVSAFNPIPLFHDTVYQVSAIGQRLADVSSIHVTEVTRSVTWPNEAVKVPGTEERAVCPVLLLLLTIMMVFWTTTILLLLATTTMMLLTTTMLLFLLLLLLLL